jgi:hypothetical protein
MSERLKFDREEVTISEAVELERGLEILREVERLEQERDPRLARPPLFPHIQKP